MTATAEQKPTKLAKLKSRAWLVVGLPTWMLALQPTLADFLNNRYQVSVQDLILPVVLATLAAAIVTAVFGRRSRLARGGYFAALLTVALLTNGYESRLQAVYPALQAVLPLNSLGGLESPMISLIFIILIFAGAYWVGRGLVAVIKRFNWSQRDISVAIGIAIAAAFLFQGLPTARDLVIEWPQFFYKPPTSAQLAAAKVTSTKPDIYYIVLDRYASQSVLTNQFNFTNSDFINFLGNQGYYTNPNAHNNYPYTTMSISSTLNADYQTDLIKKFGASPDQTIVPYHAAIQNSSVIAKLKSLGYQYDLLGSWYDATNKSPLADNLYQTDGQFWFLGKLTMLDDLDKSEISGTWAWRFIQQGLTIGHLHLLDYHSQSGTDMTMSQLATLKSLAAKTTGGRLILAHILVPHDPYYFNADGSLSTTPASDNSGQPIKQKYLGQVQYINSQMKQILTEINQKSNGQAVVVLQADEGPYPVQLNDQNFSQQSVDDELQTVDMRSWSTTDLKMKFGNLAAYHIPAAKPADLAAGADSVDVFRLIFNSYFGTKFNYLPQCYYAYPNGRDKTFLYADITDRLIGHASPGCTGQ